MNPKELERLLQVTAANTTYPATPDLTNSVLARIAATSPKPQPRLRPSMPKPLFATLLLLALISIAALLVTPSRDAIARLFGVDGSKIEVVPVLPTPSTITTPVRADGPRPIGTPLPLSEIAEAVGFEPALPTTGDPPLQSSVLFYGDQAVVVVQYADFDLWQARLQQGASFGKLADEESILVELSVNSEPATWLSGGQHFVRYLDPEGNPIAGSDRTVNRSTLIWRTPNAFYRLETDLSLAEALRIAETLP